MNGIEASFSPVLIDFKTKPDSNKSAFSSHKTSLNVYGRGLAVVLWS